MSLCFAPCPLFYHPLASFLYVLQLSWIFCHLFVTIYFSFRYTLHHLATSLKVILLCLAPWPAFYHPLASFLFVLQHSLIFCHLFVTIYFSSRYTLYHLATSLKVMPLYWLLVHLFITHLPLSSLYFITLWYFVTYLPFTSASGTYFIIFYFTEGDATVFGSLSTFLSPTCLFPLCTSALLDILSPVCYFVLQLQVHTSSSCSFTQGDAIMSAFLSPPCYFPLSTSAVLDILLPVCYHVLQLASIAQLVSCLTTDPGATRLIPSSETFVEIDHEINSLILNEQLSVTG